MITHTATFENLAKAPVRQTDIVVARQLADPYGYYDGEVIWTSSDYLMSVSIDAVGAFLGTATKKATVKLLGIVDAAASGDIFQVRTGLYNEDQSVPGYEYISQGFFIVDTVEYDYEAGSTTVTMYDHMWSAQNTSYPTGAFAFPTTIYGLAQQIAASLGVDLMEGFDALPNATFAIDSDPYATISNATLQTVLGEIAAATGTIARISDTTLVFYQFRLNESIA